MLVLTRKPGEKIIVGNTSAVEVVSVERGVVKLAFTVSEPVTLMPGNVLIDVGPGPDGGQARPITVTRKVDDSVLIGLEADQQVEVLIVSVKGEAVRLGVSAPRDVQVHRQEVFELIQRENIAAAQARQLDPEEIRRLLSERSPANPGDETGEGDAPPTPDSPPGNGQAP